MTTRILSLFISCGLMVSIESLCYSDPWFPPRKEWLILQFPLYLPEEQLPTQKSYSPPLLSSWVAGLILAGHSLMSMAQAGHKPWGPGHGTSLMSSVCCWAYRGIACMYGHPLACSNSKGVEAQADAVLLNGLSCWLEQTRKDTLCQWETPPTPFEDSNHQVQAHLYLPRLSCREGGKGLTGDRQARP